MLFGGLKNCINVSLPIFLSVEENEMFKHNFPSENILFLVCKNETCGNRRIEEEGLTQKPWKSNSLSLSWVP